LKVPGIRIQQYLERIHKYASCSSQCFIMALIYIDRLIQRNNFLLTELNVHRVIVTAILLAAKFFDDAYYNNAYYAKVGGVLTSEMNGLEVDFLFRINFSLHVTPELFEQYRNELLSHSGDTFWGAPNQSSQFHMMQQQQAQQQQFAAHLPQHQVPANIGMPQQHETMQHGLHQITPSPTRPEESNTGMMMSKAEDEIMAVIDRSSFAATLPNLFPYECGYLQRANSMPVQSKPFVNQAQNDPSQPLSAPTMMAMVPGAGNDQYVVLDNQVYQLTGAAMTQNHMAANDASNLIRNVHHPAAAHHHDPGVSGFVSREAAVTQRLLRQGQMVAGVSGL